MSSGELQNAYDEHYYRHYAERPYERDPHWLEFFSRVAQRIADEIQPGTVLDAGCAMGFLVEALRERGVEAMGVDVSPFALTNVSDAARPHCWLGSLTDALPHRFDLIVCIEVLEHLTADDARVAIERLCTATDDVLMSSTPFDYKDATHENVRPPDYWAALFARHGFHRDLDYDASYVAPWAMRFRRQRETQDRTVARYERRLWELEKENQARRALTLEQRAELARLEREARAHDATLAEQRRTLEALGSQVADRQQEVALLGTQVYEQQQAVERERARARAQEEAVATLQAQVGALDGARALLAQQLAELEEQAGAARADATAARAALATREDAIAELEDARRSLVERLSDVEARLAREGRARDASLDTLKRRLVEKDDTLRMLAGRIAETERASRTADEHWQLITSSRGWALLQAVWRFRARFLPRRRRRAVAGAVASSDAAEPIDPAAVVAAESEPDFLPAHATVEHAQPRAITATAEETSWSEHAPYLAPAGVSERRIAGRPVLSTAEGGLVAIDDRLLDVWRRARGRSVSDLLAGAAPEHAPALRVALACLAEAGLLARPGGATDTTPPAAAPGTVRGSLVSAVVVAFDGKDWLASCLPSLFAQTYASLEVIVVDNGSRDGTAEWLAAKHPRVRLLRLDRSLSLAAAINRGVALARGSAFLILNQDVQLAPDAVAELMAAARARTGVAAFVPKLRFSWAPSFLNGLGNVVRDAGWGSDDGIGHLDLGQLDHRRSLASGCFAALLVPRAAWQEVGPADERFALYYEDAEWCHRARLLGKTIQAAPRAIVYHAFGSRVASGEDTALSPRKLRHVALGRLRFATKLVPRPLVGRFVKTYLREDRSNAREALRARDLGTVRAYVSAWSRFAAALPSLLRERRELHARADGLGRDLFAFEPEPLRPLTWRGLPELTWDLVVEHYLPLVSEGRTRPMPELAAAARPPRLLIVSQDVVDRKLAGPGMRYLEMARALAGELDVTLAVPADTTLESPPVKLVRYHEDRPGSLHLLVENADVAVVSGYMARKFAFLEHTETRLVVDLYDPLVLENLHYHVEQPLRAQEDANVETVEVTNQLAKLGDFFICGNERQRDFWLGTLAANRRVNPRTFAQDPSLDALIDVVGIGFPCHAPRARTAVLRGVHPAFPAESRIVLWGGGIWDWLDPLTLVRAWPQVLAAEPTARLVFLGTRHPNPLVPRHRMAERTEDAARELGEHGRTVFFHEWLDYEDRESLLCEADVGVALHPLHVETRFSVRTRVLDYLWARLPVVITQGDLTSEWVHAHGVGRVVPPDDADAVARSILDLLVGRDALAPAFDPLHARFTWDRVVEPLRRYCLAGARAADRVRGVNGH